MPQLINYGNEILRVLKVFAKIMVLTIMMIVIRENF